MSQHNNKYQIGDGLRIHANFTDISCVAADPSSIYFRLIVGSADLAYTWPTTNAIVKSDTGSFYHAITVESPGEYLFYWRGYGSVQAAEYGSFIVHTPPSQFMS